MVNTGTLQRWRGGRRVVGDTGGLLTTRLVIVDMGQLSLSAVWGSLWQTREQGAKGQVVLRTLPRE